jgi:hypothetical protein
MFYKQIYFFILVAPLKYFPVTKKLPIHLCTHHIYHGWYFQGSILAPILYNIFTLDIPHSDDTFIATFAVNTAIISFHSDPN